MKRQSQHRQTDRQQNYFQSVRTDNRRKPRDANGGKYDGVNHDTDLGDFLRCAYRAGEQRKAAE